MVVPNYAGIVLACRQNYVVIAGAVAYCEGGYGSSVIRKTSNRLMVLAGVCQR